MTITPSRWHSEACHRGKVKTLEREALVVYNKYYVRTVSIMVRLISDAVGRNGLFVETRNGPRGAFEAIVWGRE